MKMVEDEAIAKHPNESNTIIIQITSIGINFDDEVKALLILFYLPTSYDGLVIAFSNSSDSRTLKFVDIVSVILNEKIHRESSSESLGSVVNVENRGRTTKRE